MESTELVVVALIAAISVVIIIMSGIVFYWIFTKKQGKLALFAIVIGVPTLVLYGGFLSMALFASG